MNSYEAQFQTDQCGTQLRSNTSTKIFAYVREQYIVIGYTKTLIG